MKQGHRRFLKIAANSAAAPILARFALSATVKDEQDGVLMESGNTPGFRLVENGTAQASLVLPDEMSEVLSFAADEMCKYVRFISSATLPIRTLQDAPSGKQLLLGSPSKIGRELRGVNKTDWPASGTDEFLIKVTKDTIVLCGGSDRSTLYAVYTLLEEMGCRWLAPGQDYLPKNETIDVALNSRKFKPAMKWRVLMLDKFASTIEFIDWFAKQRFNILFLHPIPMMKRLPSEHQKAIERRGLSVMGGGHSPAFLLPIEEYSRAHPDWFSLINGKRAEPGDWPWKICHSNDEAVHEFNRNLVQFLQAYPFVDFFVLWENDSEKGWCECNACRALEPTPDHIDPVWGVPDRSVTYFRWVKQVDEAVRVEVPRARVLFGPYYNLSTFPRNPTVLPPRDCVLMLDEYQQCYRHAFSDPCNRSTQDRLIHVWRGSYPESTDWAYYNTRVCGVPYGLSTRIVKDMRYLWARGVNGFLDDMGLLEAPDLATMFGKDSLNFYVLAKFAWDPSLDLNQVTRDFTTHGYGPVAEMMQKFYDLLDTTTYGFGKGSLVPEDKAYLKEIHTGFFMSPRAYIPNRERLEELKSLVSRALEESMDDAVRQRIQPLVRGMEVAECLWDAEELPPHERLLWIPKIRELAGIYLQPVYDPEISYGNKKDPTKTRLQIVLDTWMEEAANNNTAQ